MNEQRPYPLCPWVGSKSRIARNIIQHFPPGKPVADIFGGSGVIVSCVGGLWNDIDPRLWEIAQALLYDRENLRRRSIQLEKLSYSEGKDLWDDLKSDLGSLPAAELIWCLHFTWGARLGGRFQGDYLKKNQYRRWINYIDRCAEIWNRIRLYRGDFREVPLDGEILFLDPPYPNTSNSTYSQVAEAEEIVRFAERYDGDVFLCGWENSYPGLDWPRVGINGGARLCSANGYKGGIGNLTVMFSKKGFQDLFRG